MTAGARGEGAERNSWGKEGQTDRKQVVLHENRKKEDKCRRTKLKMKLEIVRKLWQEISDCLSQGHLPALPATRGLLYSKNIMEKQQISPVFPL